MLKRLELVGFKSFADKTQFDFTAGLTAIVGPNGSGKSNIVDAVRWILGEQSAKSLRGGEMADVIFNGSASRRSFGLAEVTMTFDNTRRILATNSDEVQITRRVYRSGEGEYLINHQISRLKDIKDLFLGSGAGADAYCIIEQGRVDVLLQASTRDRRTIFEEAAGISRFKSKKIEALRKLERVDQNWQRLQDIIEEVEKQLRSVKLQAAKAQRYQEYSNRLKELRVALGLEEYHHLTQRLQTCEAGLERLRTTLEAQAAQAEAWEGETRRLEETLARVEEATHEQETLLAAARQQIAAEETTLSREWSLSTDLETDLAATRTRMTELNARVAGLAAAAAQATEELGGIEGQGQQQRREMRALEEEMQAAVLRLAELQNQIQADKNDHLEQMRQASRLQNDVVAYKADIDNLRRERDRLLHKTEQAAEHLATLDVALQELTQADEALQRRLTATRQTQVEQRQERDRQRQGLDKTNQALADLRAQRSGLASRIEVLEGLERSQEGLGTGVREVVALLGAPSSEPWGSVLGMLADVLTVRREFAPLIDLALGDRAQRFLVRDPALLAEALRSREQPFSGRVSFLPLSVVLGPSSLAPGQEAVPADGVIARADRVVTCDKPELAELPSQLLGNTLIVLDLATARKIRETKSAYRLVTMQGELLEPDGTLTVGVHHAETGILSRKSELRELRQQAAEVDQRIADTERNLADLREQVAAADGRLESLKDETDVLTEQEADLRSRLGQHRQRREGLHEEVTTNRREISVVESDIRGLEASWTEATTQAEAAESRVQALQSRLEQADHEMREREQQRQLRQQEVTVAKVALGKFEERLAGLRAKHRQLETDLEQRRQERLQGEQHLAGAKSRLDDSQRAMLHASSVLAQGYLEKEKAERRVAELVAQRDRRRQQRHQLAEKSQAIRNEWRTRQEEAHASELEVNDFRHRRDTLTERLREDYQIELAEVYLQAVSSGRWAGDRGQASGVRDQGSEDGRQETKGRGQQTVDRGHGPGEAPPEASQATVSLDSVVANEEIVELRRKLSRLGSVNLDSLQELAELEARHGNLQVQSDDLTAAKRSLEEIISAINQDSRRLFTETFASIRTHFQELFRKLFGGGMADVLLEDETDVLESGIEIIARPPGKELRSISLMSGGEKTLTAVALLLAVFRSKPSPFCILDEVDAALDEANIARYTAVLREFLDRSQFIIITHSKKTMASADVLYGITMQESGVSKRVAVRFEDWPEADNTSGYADQTEVA